MLAEIAEGKEEAILINKNNSLLKIRVLQSVLNMKESFKRYVFIFIRAATLGQTIYSTTSITDRSVIETGKIHFDNQIVIR